MDKGTFWLESKANGEITIGIEDYGVGVFGGGDHEMMWTLDPENTKKLADILSRTNNGSLENMIEKEFGIHLDKKSLSRWLDENGIHCKFFTWTS